MTNEQVTQALADEKLVDEFRDRLRKSGHIGGRPEIPVYLMDAVDRYLGFLSDCLGNEKSLIELADHYRENASRVTGKS